MAMLRVSSYRRLFDWSPNGGSWARCAGQYQAFVRAATTDKCDCDKLDLSAAKSLSKESLDQLSQERTTIASLNDRLVRLIELARCFEEENSSLEHQVAELRGKLNGRQGPVSSASAVAQSDSSLDAVVNRLRKDRDEILQDTDELQVELECLMKECKKVVRQRTLLQQEQQGIAEEVDAVTAGCLALRDQVAIYEEQLATEEARHEMEGKGQLVPAEWTRSAVAAIKFDCPDMTPALDVKEYYSQLAESLQCVCGAAASDPAGGAGGGLLEAEDAASGARDVGKMKMLVCELQRELCELEKYNLELEDDMELRKVEHSEEISGLEQTIDEMNRQEVDLREQMQEQCDDYRTLLAEKMARDMEIAAYRGLVEGEEGRLCNL